MSARVLSMAAFALTVGCAAGKPDEIAYDADECAYCHMQISDAHFASTLVTVKGKTYKFDSIECLVAYYKTSITGNTVASVWVSDARHPGTMLNATQARFVSLGGGRSPMGRGLAAVASARDAAAIGVIDSTSIKHWSDLK